MTIDSEKLLQRENIQNRTKDLTNAPMSNFRTKSPDEIAQLREELEVATQEAWAARVKLAKILEEKIGEANWHKILQSVGRDVMHEAERAADTSIGLKNLATKW